MRQSQGWHGSDRWAAGCAGKSGVFGVRASGMASEFQAGCWPGTSSPGPGALMEY